MLDLTTPNKLLENARKLKDAEKFEEALEICEKLIFNMPQDNKVKRFYIELLFTFGYHLNDPYIEGYEKAVDIFGKIFEIEPNNYKAIYNKGIAYFYLEKMENALTCFSKAIELKPDYKFPYYNIGLVHETMGNLHEALDYYNKALEIDADFVYAIHAKDDIMKKIKFLNVVSPKPKIDMNKLKGILEASKRVRISFLQEILKIRPDELDIIVDWCKKYQFEIDGDFLIINKGKLSELIDSLDYV